MPSELIALVSCPQNLADSLAGSLVEKKVAACVNIIKEVTSVYRWEGNIEKDAESLLIIKTNSEVWTRFKQTVEELHPYEVPEIIAVPIEVGNQAYLNWLNQSVTTKSS